MDGVIFGFSDVTFVFELCPGRGGQTSSHGNLQASFIVGLFALL